MNIKYLTLVILILSVIVLSEVTNLWAQSDTSSSLPDLIPYRKGEKWGFCDKDKNIIIKPSYNQVNFFDNNLAVVKSINGKFGCIQKDDKEFIPFKYDIIDYFKEGRAIVKINSKWGFIDSLGNEIIPLSYDYVNRFYDGLAVVKMNDKYGFVDIDGKEVITLRFDVANRFLNGLARVKLNGKWGIINKDGKEVILVKYDSLGIYKEGLAPFKLKSKWGFIDANGKEIIPAKYEDVNGFSEGYASIRINGKWGYINKEGKEVIQIKYDGAGTFHEGLAQVKLKGRGGYIDNTGKEIISLKYENVNNFSDGLAAVVLYGKVGFINKEGKVIIPLKYEGAGYFQNGITWIKENGKTGFINKSGQQVISAKYVGISGFYHGLANAFLGDKWGGYIDINGTEYWEELPENSLADIDDNIYRTVKMGNQIWMAENLNAEHYRNGDIIPQVQEPNEWANLKTGAWCYYENNSEIGKIYGKLYNWYAVHDSRGLAPKGWHIPTEEECITLQYYVGKSTSGIKLKSSKNWIDINRNTNGTDDYGFTVLPGGTRGMYDSDDKFFALGNQGIFWTSTTESGAGRCFQFTSLDPHSIFQLWGKKGGLSIRCVKD